MTRAVINILFALQKNFEAVFEWLFVFCIYATKENFLFPFFLNTQSMKRIFFILFLLPFIGFSQFKVTRPYAKYYSEVPLNVYKEAAGLNKIGEIAAGSGIIFIVGPGGVNSYLVYRKGVTGYISKSHLLFEGKEPSFNENDLVEAMIAAAKKQEEEYDTFINAKKELDRIDNALKE